MISGNLHDQTINDVKDDLLKAGELLDNTTSCRLNCLKVFAKSVELVTWLRKNIKGRTFSDFLVIK